MGRIFGRWLLASLALGAVAGGVYGLILAWILMADEQTLVADAPVAMLFGVGMGVGSMAGLAVGLVLGLVLGTVMAAMDRRRSPHPEDYLRRIRVVAAVVPLLVGLLVLVVLDRVLSLDVVPVVGSSLIWALAARKIAAGYLDAPTHDEPAAH